MKPTDNSLEKEQIIPDYSTSQDPTPTTSLGFSKIGQNTSSPFRYNKTAMKITIIALVVIALIGGGSFAINPMLTGKAAKVNTQMSSNFAVGSNLSLQHVKGSRQLELGQANQLNINGKLNVSKALTLKPNTAPNTPVPGEIYFNQLTNLPYFFNGSQFVALNPVENQTSQQTNANFNIQSANGQIAVKIQGAPNQNIIDLYSSTNNTTPVASFSSTGNLTAGTINGQTISSAANFTGGMTIQGGSGLTIGIVGTTAGQLTLASSTAGGSFTISPNSSQANSTSLSIPADTNATDTLCLKTLGNCSTGSGSGVSSLNGESGSIAIAGTSNQLTVTPSGQNITLSLPQNINTTASVQFGSLALGAALGVPSGGTGLSSYTSGSLLYANGASSLITLPIGASNYCLVSNGTVPSWTNCSSTSGVTESGATAGYVPLFNASNQQVLNNSVLSQSGTTLSSSGNLNLSGGSINLGTAATAGDNGQVVFNNATNTNSLTLQSGVTAANLIFTLPTADGTTGQCLTTNGSGALSFSSCLSGSSGGGSGVSSLNGESGSITIAGTSNQLTVTPSGQNITLSLPQNINTTASVQFGSLALGAIGTTAGQLTLASSTAGGSFTISPNSSQANSTSLSVPADTNTTDTLCLKTLGNCTGANSGNTNYIENQTSQQTSANFNIQSAAASDIGAIIAGAASQTANLLDLNNSSGTILSGFNSSGDLYLNNSGFSATINSATLSAAQTITIPNATGTICLTSGNCVGGGTSGSAIGGSGTSDYIAKFTAAGTIGNSLIYDNGTNVGIGTASPTSMLDIASSSATTVGQIIQGAASQTADLLDLNNSSGVTLSGFNSSGDLYYNNSGFSATINSATLSASQTITIPNATGTICLQSNTSCGFAPTSGSGNYIQNTTTQQASSNFNISGSGAIGATLSVTGATTLSSTLAVSGTASFSNKLGIGTASPTSMLDIASSSATTVGQIIQGAASQTANLLDLNNSSGTILSGFNSSGDLYLNNSGFSATINSATLSAAQTITIPNATGTICLTSGNCVGGGTSGSAIGGSGTSDYIAKFTAAGTIGNSLIYDNGTNVGIGTASPTQTLDVVGTGLFQSSTNSTTAFQVQNAAGATILSTDTTANQVNINGNMNLNQVAAPASAPSVAVNTTTGSLSGTYYYVYSYVTPSGLTNYSPVSAAISPASEEVNVTVTASSSNLVTGINIYRSTSSSGPFNLVNSSPISNTTQTYTDNITTLGVAASDINLTASLQQNGSTILIADPNNYNIGVGIGVLQESTTGSANTASGFQALQSNTTGSANTASGYRALQSNATGSANTASGFQAFQYNTTGSYNAASGFRALQSNTTGSANTASGYQAGLTSVSANANTTGSNNTFIGNNSGPGVASSSSLQNATAIGNLAVVDTSNSLVLGSINGVNGATASTNVGIGTASPAYPLDVVGNINTTGNYLINGTQISSSNLSNSANIAYLNATQTFTGANTFSGSTTTSGSLTATGTSLFKDSTNSTTAFQVQNAAGATILSTDTTANQVNINGNMNLNQVAAPTTAPTATVVAGTTLGIGNYYYVVAYVTASGTTNYGPVSAVATTTSSNQAINLSAIPTSPSSLVTARKIYRTDVGGTTSGPFYLVTTISDNTTTTYSDVTPDSSLGAGASDINLTASLKQNGSTILIAGSNNYNTGVGLGVLQSNTTGDYNTASGASALQSNTTGYNNTAFGAYALQANTTGSSNTAFGSQALYSNATGIDNTASGMYALYSNTGYFNTASGYQALYDNTTGNQNTASGTDALGINTTGNQNTASGMYALYVNTTGNQNTASGVQALYANTTGNNNVSLGYQAGYTSVSANANTTGSGNTFIGYQSGPGVASSSSLQNATAIGNQAVVNTSNSLVLGSINGANGATASTNVGIGTASPTYPLDVVGIANATTLYQNGHPVCDNTGNCNGVYYVTSYGAVGNGTTNDTTAIQNALNAANAAGGGEIYFPAGTYMTGMLTIYSNEHLMGAGMGSTIIELNNGANSDLIQSNGYIAPSSFASSDVGGIYDWSISNLTLDGNQANNPTGGNDLSVYGYGYNLNNIVLRNANTNGLYSEWGSQASSPGNNSMEAHISGLKSHNNGTTTTAGSGIVWNGPHDSTWVNVQTFLNTAKGIWLMPDSNGTQITNAHSWGSSQTYAWYIESTGNLLTGSEGEGASVAQVMVGANDNQINGGDYFAAGSTGPCIQIGDSSHTVIAGTDINTKLLNCSTGIQFNSDGGSSIIKALVYPTSSTAISGTPSVNTQVQIAEGNITLANTETIQTSVSSGNILVLQNASGSAVAGFNTAGFLGVGEGAQNYPLAVDQSSTASGWMATFFQPSLSSGGDNQVLLGISASTNNAASFSYTNNATAADSYASLGLYGSPTTLNVLGSGQVGIGTASPTTVLDVQGSNATGFISTLYNTSTATSASTPTSSSDGLLIQLGTADANRTSGNTFIGFADSTGTLSGAIVGGASAVAYNTTGADYSEYFPANNPSNLPTKGELVSLGSTNNSVAKSVSSVPIGIVSTNPGFIGNGPLCKVSSTTCQTNYNKTNVIVALTGQVPTTVSVANGSISVGDPITSSSTPGVGELATSPGYIVGYALTSTTTNGTIQVLINPGYYTPSNTQLLQANNAILNSLSVNGAINSMSINNSGLFTTQTLSVSGNASIGGSLTIGGGLVVKGMTTVQDLSVGGHIITTGKAPTSSVLSAAGTNAVVSISGNDSSGTITITTGQQTSTTNSYGVVVTSGNNPTSGDMADISFNKAYGQTPHVLITPNDSQSAPLMVYPDKQSTTGFAIGLVGTPLPNTTYTYEYFIVQ